MIRSGLSYLQPVWSNTHWRVFRVRGYHGLVDGPAQLVSLSPDAFVLKVTAHASVVTVHIHDSPHWAVQNGAGCITASPDSWVQLHDLAPGEIRVAQAFRGTRCDNDG